MANHNRYGTRYTSRLSFPAEETVTPVDTLAYYYPTPYRAASGERIIYDIYLPPVSPPPVVERPAPPPLPRKQPEEWVSARRERKRERERRRREIWNREYEDAKAWAEYSHEQTPIFLFELREQVRVSYKPPPPHWGGFSKMVPTYSDEWLTKPPEFRYPSRRRKEKK